MAAAEDSILRTAIDAELPVLCIWAAEVRDLSTPMAADDPAEFISADD